MKPSCVFRPGTALLLATLLAALPPIASADTATNDEKAGGNASDSPAQKAAGNKIDLKTIAGNGVATASAAEKMTAGGQSKPKREPMVIGCTTDE